MLILSPSRTFTCLQLHCHATTKGFTGEGGSITQMMKSRGLISVNPLNILTLISKASSLCSQTKITSAPSNWRAASRV
jgi:hypothetical protein